MIDERVCKHCEGYSAERDGLCGDCLLKSPELREAESKFKARMIAGRKKADDDARKLYADEIKKLNQELAEETLGKGNSIHNATDKVAFKQGLE